MSAREWIAGEAALVNDRYQPSAPHQRAFCFQGGVVGEARFVLVNGVKVWGSVTDARPLAVIDPEDREQVERLRDLTLRCLREHIGDYQTDGFTDTDLANAMQAALREFANPTPPRPEEPTGLGAVVVDSNNVTWVLAGRDLTDRHDNWRAHDGSLVGNWRPYSRIDAVTVLSEGVQP